MAWTEEARRAAAEARRRSSEHLWWLPAVSYGGAHRRIYKLWGRASQYTCITCGQQAYSWSYDGTDPAERKTKHALPMRYSQWPEFYAPKCQSCHKLADLKVLVRPYQPPVRPHRRGDHLSPQTETEWDQWHKERTA